MKNDFAVSMTKPVCLGFALLRILCAPSRLKSRCNSLTRDFALTHMYAQLLILECSSCVNVWCQLSLAFHFALRSSCVPRWRRYISTQSQYTVQIALIGNLKESRHPRRCRSVALTMTSLSHCQFLAQVLAASRGLKPNRLRNQFVSHMSSNFKLQVKVMQWANWTGFIGVLFTVHGFIFIGLGVGGLGIQRFCSSALFGDLEVIFSYEHPLQRASVSDGKWGGRNSCYDSLTLL